MKYETTYKYKKYRSMESFQRQIERAEILDWFNIGGYWYTIEEYDESGKEMRYISLLKQEELIIHTPNRYKTGLKGATIEVVEPMCYRFEPAYYLPIEDFKKLSNEQKREISLYIAKIWDSEVLINYIFN